MINDIVQGDTRDIEVTVQDSSGIAFDVTGYTVKMYVKSNITDETNLLDITGSIVSAVNGEIKIPLSVVDTEQSEGLYYYWIVINIGTTNVYTVSQGTFNIIAGK